MNYSLTDIPDSGKNPVVNMEICINGEFFGMVRIKLFREVFPAGVENFVKISAGKTYQITKKGANRVSYTKDTRRSYDGCAFYHFSHNNYIVSGDIYNNDGTKAGTIYNDMPIPAILGDFYYPHESKGLVSLIPYHDEASGNLFYDSTFMITLDNVRPTNVLKDLDADQIVIGQISEGIDLLDRINCMIKPFAGRRYPKISIGRTEVYRTTLNTIWRIRPTPRIQRKFINQPINTIIVPDDTIIVPNDTVIENI